jgi:hypothetical protein
MLLWQDVLGVYSELRYSAVDMAVLLLGRVSGRDDLMAVRGVFIAGDVFLNDFFINSCVFFMAAADRCGLGVLLAI